MKRTAMCQCGELSVKCDGEISQIFMCHCEMCQRRTGSSYNLGAWFTAENVSAEGEEKIYKRTGELGTEWEMRFCPKCGTSVYWTLEAVFPGQIGVAVGCFADPGFPEPTVSVYGERRHKWLQQPQGMPSHVGTLGTELE